MKRVVKVRSHGGPEIEVVACIKSNGTWLTRDEVERIRDALADRLMGALVDLPYSDHRLSRMKVSG